MIYLAAPFFCERELTVVKRVEQLLKKYGIPFFSPRLGDDNDLPPEEKMKPENARKIFDMDMKHMDDALLCLAFIDGYPFHNAEKNKDTFARDMGTAFEMGYFYARGTPIITYSENDQPTNLMLANATWGHYATFGQLVEAFDEIEPIYESTELWFKGLAIMLRNASWEKAARSDE